MIILVMLKNAINKYGQLIKKNWQIYLAFISISIKISLQEKVGMILFTFGKLARFGIFFLFAYFLLQRTHTLAGYTNQQVMIFFITYSLIDNLAQLFFREVYRFLPLIISGDFDTVLVKPFNPLLKVLFGGFDLLDLIPFFTYILFLIYFARDLFNNPLTLLMYTLLVLCGFLIAMALHIFILAASILISDVDHMIMIYRDLSRLASLPVEIYPEILRELITYAIPLAIMFNFPARALVGILSPNEIWISISITTVILLLAWYTWLYALRRYHSASS